MSRNREGVATKDSHWPVVQKFSKPEVVASAFHAVMVAGGFLMLLTVGILLSPNDFLVPLNYNIVGLPDDHIFVVWTLNYIHQISMIACVDTPYVFFNILTYLIMNHSCYLVDSTLVYVEKLNNALNRGNDPPSHPLQRLSIVRNLRKVADMVEDIVTWQKAACSLLQLVLWTVFAMNCSLLCLMVLSLTANPTESFIILILLLLGLGELFFCCWMGSRVMTKFEMLTTSLHGINWDRMVPNHRKDLLFILSMSQNIKPYHGVI